MKLREMLLFGRERLAAAGVPDAAFDARALCCFVTGETLASYPLHSEAEVPEAHFREYAALIGRRAGREPLQYITGRAPFYGRDFMVNPSVLIPRFDTETLVEAVLPKLSGGARILDLCIGSGCVLLTLLLEGPEDLCGVGSDISSEALDVARANALQFGVRNARFVQSDLFAGIDGRFRLITANPPYIRLDERESLDLEVRDFEPELALFGGADGLDCLRSIVRDAGRFLEDGGTLALETGCEETAAVQTLMEEAGFTALETRRDLAGRGRVVLGDWRYV